MYEVLDYLSASLQKKQVAFTLWRFKALMSCPARSKDVGATKMLMEKAGCLIRNIIVYPLL